ncbi:MAG: HEAT repeat domain-containing protein [Candidatus Hydrogenedentes bacterium]|nr:HEAT repeat domain-containing protein [Candidatus Hydrogenedentota bacterium]
MWLRLLFALYGGQRLRRRAQKIDDATLLDALARHARALGLRAAPALAYCERIAVPTVVGVLRPLILLPLTVHTGLTPPQVELLLCHELAHIRRYDHLFNLLQSIIESFLFFHPAVLLVSRRIRLEREHCCDDLVLELSGESLLYADSLLKMAEASRGLSVEALLLSAAGKPSQLSQRIHRILNVPAPRLRLTRSGLLVLLLSAALGVFAVVQVSAAPGEQGLQGQEDEQELKGQEEPETSQDQEQATAEQSTPPDSSDLSDPSDPSDSSDPAASSIPSIQSIPPPATPQLQTHDPLWLAFHEPDWWLRVLAVQEIAKSSNREAAVSFLTQILRSGSRPEGLEITAEQEANEYRVRAAAAEALGQLKAEEAIPYLVASLREVTTKSRYGTTALREASSIALAKFPPEKVMPLLRTALNDQDSDMISGACMALSYIGTPEALQLIAEKLAANGESRKDEDFEDWLIGTISEYQHVPPGAWAQPATALLSGPSPKRMAIGAIILANTGVADPPEEIVRLAANEAPLARRLAIQSLARFPSPLAAETLVQVLTQDPAHEIRAAAATALKTRDWQPATPEQEAAYIVALNNFEVASTLDGPVLEPLKIAFNSTSRDWRMQAADAFGRAAPPEAALALAPLFKDRENDVRRYALGAAQRLRNPEIAPDVALLLKDEDGDVRATATETLGILGNAAAIPALVTATHDPRIADDAVVAINAIGGGEAQEALLKIIADASVDPEHRVEAANFLMENADLPLLERIEAVVGKIEPQPPAQPAPPRPLLTRPTRPRSVDALNVQDRLREAVGQARERLNPPAPVPVPPQPQEPAPPAPAPAPEPASPPSAEPPESTEATEQAPAAEPSDVPAPIPPILPIPPISPEAAPATPLGDVNALLLQLQDTDYWLRKVAAQKLGELGAGQGAHPEAQAPVPVFQTTMALTTALKDEKREVRAAAAHALGQIADPRAIKHLVAALKDDYREVQEIVAKALAVFGPEQTMDLLKLAASDNDHNMRRGTVLALRELATPEAVELSVSLLEGAVGELYREIEETLPQLPPELVFPPLTAALQSSSVDLVTGSAKVLAKIGTEEARLALVEVAQNPDATGRHAAVSALTEFKDEASTQVLTALLNSPDLYVRRPSALELKDRYYRPETPEAQARYLVALSAWDDVQRLGAAAVEPLLQVALASQTQPEAPTWNRQDPGQPQGRETLEQRTVNAALGALGQLKDPKTVEPLLKLLKSEEPWRRRAAADALGAIADARAVPAFLELLNDPERDVRRGITYALAAMNPPEASPALQQLLTDPDPGVRAGAAWALGHIQAEAAIPNLIVAFSDINDDVRGEAQKALQEIGLPALRALDQQFAQLPQDARIYGINTFVDRLPDALTLCLIALDDPSQEVNNTVISNLHSLATSTPRRDRRRDSPSSPPVGPNLLEAPPERRQEVLDAMKKYLQRADRDPQWQTFVAKVLVTEPTPDAATAVETWLNTISPDQLDALRRNNQEAFDAVQGVRGSLNELNFKLSTSSNSSSSSIEVDVNKQEFQAELYENYAAIVEKLKPELKMDEAGAVTGLTCENLGQIPLAAKLGFQEGDVLQSINGGRIDSVESLWKLLEFVKDLEYLRVVVQRDGAPKTLLIRFR